MDSVERPKTDDAKPKRVLTGAELTRLVDSVYARHRLIFRVSAETGCRLGEALGLAWQDIDITGQTISFASNSTVTVSACRSRRLDPGACWR
ncbi:MAG TPA: hypothetical protein VG053_07040 [Solirubrobacteraceae bacterium]|nr:hypothetical protein [Solirubrobacteraceae bacterium]